MKSILSKLDFDKAVASNLDTVQYTALLNTDDGVPYPFRDYFTVDDVDYNSCPKHTIRRVPDCNNIPVMYLLTADLEQLLNHNLFVDVDPTCIRVSGPLINEAEKSIHPGGHVTAVWGSKGIEAIEYAYQKAVAHYLVNKSYKDKVTGQFVSGLVHGGEMWEFIEGYAEMAASNPQLSNESMIYLTNKLLAKHNHQFRVFELLDPIMGTWGHWHARTIS